jgi:hypothetical protein
VKVKEKDGSWDIQSDLFGKLGDFTDGIITTDTLGTAFEPEQRFENTDGTPITFDKDYFGGHRSNAPIPGPFAEFKGKELLVWKMA